MGTGTLAPFVLGEPPYRMTADDQAATRRTHVWVPVWCAWLRRDIAERYEATGAWPAGTLAALEDLRWPTPRS